MSKKLKIIPRGQYMLIEPDAEESRVNEFGLFTPSNVDREKNATGIVREVGDTVKGIKKGDHVIYGAFAGEVLKTTENGKEVELRLVFDEDVIGFLK